ncbi:MAG: ATP-binding cassette domain-containing protein [Gemmatimonadales bacterium]
MIESTEAAAISLPVSASGVVVRDLSRTFGYRLILDRLNFRVDRGAVLAVMGPNGAGKTTLLRVLSGVLKPTSGSVERSQRIGMVGHHSMLYDALTAAENLAFYCRLFGITDRNRVQEVLDLMGLSRWQHQRVGTFSRGMTQRLAVARALLAEPDLLLLDEPLSSLDEYGVDAVLQLLMRLRDEGTSMVLVGHEVSSVTQLATSIGFLVGGHMDVIEELGGRDGREIAERYREVVRG